MTHYEGQLKVMNSLVVNISQTVATGKTSLLQSNSTIGKDALTHRSVGRGCTKLSETTTHKYRNQEVEIGTYSTNFHSPVVF